jgi:hypothetical protein
VYVRYKKREEGGYREVTNPGKWSSWRTSLVRVCIVQDEIFEDRTMEAKFIFKISEKWEGYRRKQTPSYIILARESICSTSTCMNLENLHSGLLVGQRDLNFPKKSVTFLLYDHLAK